MSGFSTRNMQHYRVRTNNFVADSQDHVFKCSSHVCNENCGFNYGMANFIIINKLFEIL
jgi:hypothetical protein